MKYTVLLAAFALVSCAEMQIQPTAEPAKRATTERGEPPTVEFKEFNDSYDPTLVKDEGARKVYSFVSPNNGKKCTAVFYNGVCNVWPHCVETEASLAIARERAADRAAVFQRRQFQYQQQQDDSAATSQFYRDFGNALKPASYGANPPPPTLIIEHR
jgi:hypothetical protein